VPRQNANQAFLGGGYSSTEQAICQRFCGKGVCVSGGIGMPPYHKSGTHAWGSSNLHPVNLYNRTGENLYDRPMRTAPTCGIMTVITYAKREA